MRGFFKKVFFAFAVFATLALGGALFAQSAKPAEKQSEKKTKAELKLDKAELKKAVTIRSNGDIMLRAMPPSKTFIFEIPRNLDLFFARYMPWVDLKVVREKYMSLPDKTPDRIFTEINTVLAKSGSRFNKLAVTDGNIKSRMLDGVHLLWCGAEIANFYQYLSQRTFERNSSSDIDQWKKSLTKKIYKYPNDAVISVYTNLYFIVVGFNPKTSEVAILASNNMEVVQWIAISEMKRFNLGLYEPVW